VLPKGRSNAPSEIAFPEFEDEKILGLGNSMELSINQGPQIYAPADEIPL
jgi:hypothetical protein